MAAVDGSSNQESHHEPAEIPAHERPVVKTEKEKGKKWSDEAIADLANAFQTHECLWNMNLAEYRNKDMKNLAYEKTDEIMIAHGFTRDEYKKKWGILRGQFLREYNYENSTKKSGAGVGEIYKSTWTYYKQLEFIRCGEIVGNSNTETIAIDDDNEANTNGNPETTRICNYRFSRARRISENVFGIWDSKDSEF